MAIVLPPPNVAAKVQGFDSVVPGGRAPSNSPALLNNYTGTPGTGGVITFGTYHGQPIPEPHRMWKWDIKLPDITIQGSAAGSSASGASSTTFSPPIVQSIEVPFDNTAPVPHPIGGRHRYIADVYDTTGLRLVFFNDDNQTPIQYINAWRFLIRQFDQNTGLDNGLYQYPIIYMKQIQIFLQNQKSNTSITLVYDDCFPNATGSMRLDYASTNNRTEIMQEFVVNRFRFTMGPATPLQLTIPDPVIVNRIPQLNL